MKRFFAFFCVAVFLASCLSESSTDQSKPGTFIRYYYGGYNDKAAAFEETPDKGFILLSTVTITASEAQAAKYKIKLTKTDEFGNPQPGWPIVYPPFADGTEADYKAKGLQILSDGGYVVTGEHIKGDTSRVLVMRVDASGKVVGTASLKLGTMPIPSVVGQAVATNHKGNFVVLGASTTTNTLGDTEMFLVELRSGLDTCCARWVKNYSSGVAALANRLFIDNTTPQPDINFWAGTVTKNVVTGIRVVKTGPNAQNSYFDQLLLEPGFEEEATDFCKFGYGYAIVGSTDKKEGTPPTKADKDILFKRLGEDGSVLSSKSFPLGDGKTLVDTQNDVGNSISSTQNGGLILLASVGSLAIGGRGDNDYLLININAFGEEVWRSHFGSRFRDTGVAVRQTSDGSYAVLGTSTQGGREIMMLAKTNSQGKIE